MIVNGKVIKVGDIQSGVSQKGTPWRKKEFVVEYNGGRVMLSMLNDNIERWPVALGDNVCVSFDIHTSEYQGRTYNSISLVDVTNTAQGGTDTAGDPMPF